MIIADDYGPGSRIGPDILDAIKVFDQVGSVQIAGDKQPLELHLEPDASGNVVNDCRVAGKVNKPVYKNVFVFIGLFHCRSNQIFSYAAS
jgi:hypothetical protein